MPLYVAEYLADTGHLTTLQHGAYMLLIMHYWRRGSLPEADDQLAAIARLSAADWKKAKPILQPLFRDGWKHKRIEQELAKTAEISSKRRASAMQMHSKCSASAEQKHTQLQLQEQSHLQSKSSFSGIGSVKSGWTPPKHGATGKGRIYIRVDHPDWESYAEDYRGVHGKDPEPNQYGGKWFKVLGEASPDQQTLRAMRG